MVRCDVCSRSFEGYPSLARHFLKRAAASDSGHVMWLNRNITKRKVGAKELAKDLEAYATDANNLASWMRRTFIDRFYGPQPHPFVQALQRPTRATLLGYVVEHQHFLRQWVRSAASVIAKTDRRDVTLYEIDNIVTEFGGQGPETPAHYELLLRMGEALGLPREDILSTSPLPRTKQALNFWSALAERGHWVEIMAAMHGLELIANRDLVKEGASMRYFDPALLKDKTVPQAVKDFLREGYEADVAHSEEALALVEKYAKEFGLQDRVRAAYLQSLEAFDVYLNGRLERGKDYEGAQGGVCPVRFRVGGPLGGGRWPADVLLLLGVRPGLRPYGPGGQAAHGLGVAG
ncbi:MAG: iron-containing redox enzyme family protein [Thermoplasmata archaeon]